MVARSYQLDALDWQRVDPLLQKKVVNGERMTVTRYRFAAGGRFPHHVHEQEQISHVLAGSLTFRLGSETHPLGAGDLIVIPAGAPHEAVAGDDGAEVLSIVSPARTGADDLRILEES